MGIFAGIIGLHKGILRWAMVSDSTGDPDWGSLDPSYHHPLLNYFHDRNPSRLYLPHVRGIMRAKYVRGR